MIGVLDDVTRSMGMGFRDQGDVVVLLGECIGELGGSEYLYVEHNLEEGPSAAIGFAARVERASPDVGGDSARFNQIGARL